MVQGQLRTKAKLRLVGDELSICPKDLDKEVGNKVCKTGTVEPSLNGHSFFSHH